MSPSKVSLIRRLLSFLRTWKVDFVTCGIRWLSPVPFVVSDAPVIVFSPHQDDETLGCGGLIALKRERGIPVKVVFLTNGDAYLGGRDAESARVREAEALQALEFIGVAASDVSFWNYPDGQLRQLPVAQRAMMQQEVIRLLAIDDIAEVYVPHHADRHADHEATYDIVCRAIAQTGRPHKVCQYPIWIFWKAPLFWRWPLRQLQGWRRLNIKTVMHKKRAAIAAHDSQMAALPPGFLKRFLRPEELFY
ncbi:PIG-L family deacetylase [filamentous cyanobacterium LEGE 11480]|uniref:PIG-L family deacetylase n=1 Tax=Romeriopsis navalis LEGE 11480 TaxID=2777977 RepID=A0A928VQB3_9CYAN|nr:PIG-L family deacetylase [Romeriopsis navalis]MBE9030577.1 PIG-L family deacetylase [Romeriopsis navalis LEGE 11480]